MFASQRKNSPRCNFSVKMSELCRLPPCVQELFWHHIYTISLMTKDFVIRFILTVVSTCSVLYLAERSYPLAGVLIFLIMLSVLLTWLIVTLLKGDDTLSGFFDS